MIKPSRAKHLLPVWYQQLARGGLCLWPFPAQTTWPLVPVRIFRQLGSSFFSSHIKCTLRNLFQRDNSLTAAFVLMFIILWRPYKLGKMSLSPSENSLKCFLQRSLLAEKPNLVTGWSDRYSPLHVKCNVQLIAFIRSLSTVGGHECWVMLSLRRL